MDSAQDSYKKWGIILIVFLLIFIPAEIAFISPKSARNVLKIFSGSSVKTTEVSKKQEVLADHPKLYFVDLEFDPTTNQAIKRQSGTLQGDLELLQSKPETSQDLFNYRVDVLSPNNELTFSGWASLFKSVITNTKGRYEFRVSFPYSSGETLNIYSIDSKKLWEEKIP